MSDTVDDRFTALFRRYKNQVYDFAAGMLGDRDAAGDVVQEVFVRMYTQMRDGDDIAKPKNWLFTSIRNRCLNRIRDSRKYVRTEDLPQSSTTPNPGDGSRIILESALKSLDPGLKAALLLREYQELSYAEMAEVLGITVPAVRSLLYRARNGLREAYFKLTAARRKE